MEISSFLIGIVVGALLMKLFSATPGEKARTQSIRGVTRAELNEADKAPRRSPQDESEVEAQRLARLLVQEIMLYNAKRIKIGRTSGDLYSRLHEDIERSRGIYLERVDPGVGVDFFLQKLIDIVAEGDVKLFGLEERP